ncbi:glycosyltransferase [Autumnicola psychrophila]|uniref:Glycosyltransferase n=1 Tax=Autumnicola psychrophila TaxID=3075592 RepID=A0ABU3DU61_9FLAO|nr:glycosyltransferase [Zunongwangia sp. F225]MDT0687258.1 glycosyltransferase [Zunongwangia sp. F225]
MTLNYSFIIPVFNRPEETRELLQSMLQLNFEAPFEVVIIEDGSTISSEEVVSEFRDQLEISYYFKPNSGPGSSRNYGMERAKGNYFLILDSDVILPPDYLNQVDLFLKYNYCDCFGGPDTAHKSFSDLQKAIDYSMTSVLTTGGIRGKKSSINKFQPRSFNMGISKEAFEKTGGFGRIHPGEDPDLSLRLIIANFSTCLIPEAKVFHKRRIDWSKFYLQVKKFGLVRPILNKWHPGSAKITYWFPSIFIVGLGISLILAIFGITIFVAIYILYFGVIGIDAAVRNRSLKIGILAMPAVFIQFSGYGYGFLKSYYQIQILNRNEEEAFPQLFFKDAHIQNR